jgi:DNA-binding transcriptional ArsR family regulator
MKQDIDVATMLNNAETAAQWLKAIANPYRLMILCLLLEQELSATEPISFVTAFSGTAYPRFGQHS